MIDIQHLSPEDMEKLKIYVQSGLFTLDSGQIVIDIHNEQIQNIVIHKKVYKRKKM